MNASFDPRSPRLGQWLVVASALAWLTTSGCETAPTQGEPAPAGSKATEPSPRVVGQERPPPPASLLAGVIPQAIEAPLDGGSTWRVDAYVAVLITEQLRRSPLPFTSWRSDGTDPARPSAGYRVGPLSPDAPWAALGLREGDIVQTVNGVSTDEAGWAEQALSRAENQVTVGVFRDDVSITLAYRLMGGMAWRALMAGGDGGTPDVVAAADPATSADDSDGFRGGGVSVGGGAGVGGGTAQPRPSTSRPSTGSGGSARPSSPSSSPSVPKGTSVARCTSADVCSIDKPYFDTLVASPSKLQSQADVVPAIRNDVFSGYKLRTVKSGTAVHQLGFRSGDKITHINGHDLTNDADALQLYLGLSSTRSFKVRYVRGSGTRTKTIKVQ